MATGRKRGKSSSGYTASVSGSNDAAATAAIKSDPDQVATGPTKDDTGLIFREEVLNRRVQVLFDVDTGKDDEPMTHQWYEGSITAVQLEPANAKAVGGGKRGGKRGAKNRSAGGTNACSTTKLKATHRVEFDDGDVRWFDLVYWTGKGELKWVGAEPPAPVSHPTIGSNNDGKTVAVGTDAGKTNGSPIQPKDSANAAAPLVEPTDDVAEKTSPLVSSGGKRKNSAGTCSIEPLQAPPAKKKAKVAPHQQESPPHTLIRGTKYYVV